ncbi:MAG: 30S ribosomal protein S18 [Planctomycetota bacterium]
MVVIKKRYRKFSEKGRCRFCRSGDLEVDYKDIGTLQKLCTTQGKLFSRKRSGNCAKHQRKVKLAIKRARFIGMMPFVG